MKIDPFTPNAPIDDPARFSGRDTELGAIVDALFQTAHRNPHHVAITGARGIGKTSALLMASRIAEGNRLLLERLGVETGGFEFRMLPVSHTATRGESVEDVASALLDRLRHGLEKHSFKTTEIRWELDLKLFKVGGSAGAAVVPRVVDQLIDSIQQANDQLARVSARDRATAISNSRSGCRAVDSEGASASSQAVAAKLVRLARDSRRAVDHRRHCAVVLSQREGWASRPVLLIFFVPLSLGFLGYLAFELRRLRQAGDLKRDF
jgi:hypothetical protein